MGKDHQIEESQGQRYLEGEKEQDEHRMIISEKQQEVLCDDIENARGEGRGMSRVEQILRF